MNLGENKFFVVLGAIVIVGGGALGWLLYGASSDFSDANAKYQQQVTELNRLQTLPLYPETSNLQVLEEQKKRAAADAVTLHKQLVPMAFPLEPMTPQEFQNNLNASVKNLVEKAGKAGVKLSDRFYLGFPEYKTSTPSTDAAPALGRQLKCIELAVDMMIEKKVASIGEITRPRLPEEEKARQGSAQPTPPRPNAKGTPAPELVFKYPFEIQFVAEEKAFQNVLNELSKCDKQFYIIRPVTVKNEKPKSPKRIDKTTPAPTDGNAAPKPAREKFDYVFGAEKLNVTLHFDSVVFASNLPK